METEEIEETEAPVLAPEAEREEDEADATLRPSSLRDFVGQDGIKKHLDIFIAAAKKRNEPLEHVLFSGPPGLGKTTLAMILAKEMGVNLRITSGPAIEKAGDLGAILTNLEENDILFIDEIHRLHRTVEETLYSAMEDFVLDVVLGQGPAAKTVRLTLPHFTIVGATTRIGSLTAPLRDRFGVAHRLQFYEPSHLMTILKRSARILGVNLGSEAADKLAHCSRGTPRIANRLLKRTRDLAQVMDQTDLSMTVVQKTLDMLEVDHLGMDQTDRQILAIIIDVFQGGPVGVETMAAAVHEEVETLESVYEPYLMQLGMIQRTPRGRIATEMAYKHLGREQKVGQNKLI
ncbi:MAG: Holliday junction branch migration DNA helicase RuvB [bacterium]|nr:Holliday junction branch migration DNA helicase RuvB [bacterium]